MQRSGSVLYSTPENISLLGNGTCPSWPENGGSDHAGNFLEVSFRDNSFILFEVRVACFRFAAVHLMAGVDSAQIFLPEFRAPDEWRNGSMRFFLDTANLDEIRQGLAWGVVSGVTTNPTLVAKEEGVVFTDRIREICVLVEGPVSAEVLSLDTEGMVAEALTLAGIAPNVVVKIPMTPEGMGAVRRLTEKGIATNVTLVFSPQQALLAAAAGAAYVSPFLGRLDDVGEYGIGLVEEIAGIYDVQGIETEIIAASVRHPRHVTEAAAAGAHIATLPFKVLRQLFDHPLTTSGIRRFLEDWERWNGCSAPENGSLHG